MEFILIVEDDEEILELMNHALKRDGYQTATATTGEQALELINSTPPDLILLDLLLPEMSGLDLTKRLKDSPATRDIPIIVVTAKVEENDIVTGLEHGVADYVTKPFSLRVLLARIRANLRRRGPVEVERSREPIKFSGITIWPDRYSALIEGQPLSLTPTEFQILKLLTSRFEKYFTRSQIIDVIKGEECYITDRTVDVHIFSLRKKLGRYGELIETIRGVGYRIRR
jgi:two-component system phosphate regulon response regulator PhoB